MQIRKISLVWLLTAGTFFAFFVFGFTDNLKGGTIPALLEDLKFSYFQGGTILLGAYIGFLLATLFTGVLADLAGKKVVILTASLCLITGILGYTSTSSYPVLTASMFVLGLGMGAIEVGANTIIVDSYAEQKGKYLNLMSVFHGMGSMLAPLFAGALLTAGSSWRSIYRFDLVAVFVMFIVFLLIKMPRSSGPGTDKLDLGAVQRIIFKGPIILLFVTIALYVATEIGIASWIVEFLQKTRFQSVAVSTRSLSFFFAAIMIGRFVGSFIIDRIGYFRSMLFAACGAVVCIALGVFGPGDFSLFLPLTGLFLSIIFPTITAVVSDLTTENVGTVLGLLFTFAGVGGILGPWLIGLFSDRIGIQYGFAINLVSGLLMTLILLASMSSIKLPVKAQSVS